ncbi:multidrug resistance efflux transporter family protein [Peribacillus saganii]|uniref:Multidrug resistance efflux transporter family protein n=1 Tax=Peribacillus saganii TaxID=2303992 RepID=A0A372LIV3_9BACI|nr:multidrug resistance efflux transporter family protein [Peribacillus saganii]RFU66339.1 multidrug resistance efflux transporter family protein [Peribacillus saganii]
MNKAILLGILASFFFAFTFVLNRAMELSGGSWIWSSSLRFFFMIPFLFIIVGLQGNLKPLFASLKQHPLAWLTWSTVGFGLFYAPLTYASSFGPGWLIAGTWQITIVAGTLLIPFLQKNSKNAKQSFPIKGLVYSLLILLGVAIMQSENAGQVSAKEVILCVLPILLAAFAYPLGNRKMMELCGSDLGTFQRVLGMTIASMPLWIALSIYGFVSEAPPSSAQLAQTFIVALSSGVVATVLYFFATNMVKHDMHSLAAVEATQSGAVLFSLLGEIVFLKGSIPGIWSIIGIIMVITGMILHSLFSGKPKAKQLKRIAV